MLSKKKVAIVIQEIKKTFKRVLWELHDINL